MKISPNSVAFIVQTGNGSNSSQVTAPGQSLQYSTPQSVPYQYSNATDVFITSNYPHKSFGQGRGRFNNCYNSNNPQC